MTRKKPRGPKSSAQVWNYQTWMFLPPTIGNRGRLGLENQLSGRRDEAKTRVEHQPETMKRKTKITSPILGWAPKRVLTQDAQLLWRNQRTRALELQHETGKIIQGLCLSLLSLLMICCFPLSSRRGRLSFHTLFLSPSRPP